MALCSNSEDPGGEGRHNKEADKLVTAATWPLDWRACFLLSPSFHLEGAQLISILASLPLFTLSAPGKKGSRFIQLVL